MPVQKDYVSHFYSLLILQYNILHMTDITEERALKFLFAHQNTVCNGSLEVFNAIQETHISRRKDKYLIKKDKNNPKEPNDISSTNFINYKRKRSVLLDEIFYS